MQISQHLVTHADGSREGRVSPA